MPVCGETNGQHYWNRCYLRKDECRSQQRIGFINGPCKSKFRLRAEEGAGVRGREKENGGRNREREIGRERQRERGGEMLDS